MKGALFQFDPNPGVVPPGSITNAELANMAARTVKVNATNASASPQDLQGTTPLDVLRVNAAGDGLEWGPPTNGLYVLKAGDTMTGPLQIDTSQFSVITLNRVDDGSTGPRAVLRHTSTTPAVSDLVGAHDFQGYDNTNVLTLGGRLSFVTTNVTNGAYAGYYEVGTTQAGVFAGRWRFGNGFYANGATGGDQGAGTINAVNYFDDGVNINTIYAGLASANVFTTNQKIGYAASGLTPTSPTSTQLLIENTDTGASGAIINGYLNNNTAGPTTPLRVQAFANNSSGNPIRFGRFAYSAITTTAGAEQGEIVFETIVAGTLRTGFKLTAGVYGDTLTDKGINTVNFQGVYANDQLIMGLDKTLRSAGFTFATLPAGNTGARAYITDSSTITFWADAAGGGANVVPVFFNSAVWKVG